METTRCTMRSKCTDYGRPVGAIWMNTPDSPKDCVVLGVGFQRTVDDASILQDNRVQSRRDIEISDLLHIGAILVHAEQLLSRPGIPARWDVGVAVASEDNLPIWGRGWTNVVYTPPQCRLDVLWATVVRGPVSSPRVRCEDLIR